MTEEQRDLLCRGLTRLGVPYTPEAVERLGLYCRRLLEKNQVMNLTAITDPADVMTLHFLDSAALLPTRALGGRKLIDVGTGAGFPGLVLRILDPTIRLTLLDSLGKRVEWLTELCRELDLPDVVLLKGRAEELSRRKTHREQYDVAVSRALAAMPMLAELCLPYVKPGGLFLAMKSNKTDEEIAGAVRESLESRGIRVMTGVKVKALEQAEGKALVAVDNGKEVQKLEAEAVLVATGRRPNTAGLNLEAAGVEIGPRGGIVTDDSLTTTAPHIYAMGDVRGGLQFTYISLDDFRIVKSKVLGDGSYTLKERGAVPYSVFLIPPFSRVGLSEKEAVEKGYKVKVARLAAAAIPKAQVLEQPAGLLKAVIDEETGLILGAHLFCQESYEMINMIKLAMDAKVPYQVLRDTIYTHPTMSEAFNDLFAV